MFRAVITRLQQTPILFRIAIGNAVIITLSAIIGTALTHWLTNASATLWHFVLFASIGIIISLGLNFVILNLSLRPLRELRQIVNDIQAGEADASQLALSNTDPDIHQLTIALNSLVSQLSSSNHQLRMLSERAINAQEEERKRIARSLHDDTGQSLSTLIINLDRLEKHIPAGNAELLDQLKSIRQIATNSLECLRGIMYDLRPAILDDLGLVPAIRWYAQKHLEEAGIQVQLELPDELPQLASVLATTLFRVTQEGVSNIIRHAHASKVTIGMGMERNEVYLRIQDNGQGFTPTDSDGAFPEMQHWGLIGIQERIELVGGRMSMSSTVGEGTTLQVNAPLIMAEVRSNG